MTENSRNDHWASWLMAVQFLTRIPVRSPGLLTDQAAGRSLLYYPLVGLLIGVLLGLAQWLLESCWAGQFGVQAAVLLTLWCLLTGGLHLDGLADSADAWVGGYGDRERTLAIMKDPYAGPAGIMVTVLVLLGKWAMLSAVLEAQLPAWWLVPVLARGYLLLLFYTTDYVREGGLGAVLSQHFPRQSSFWLLLLMGASMLLFDAFMLGLSFLVFAGLRYLMNQRLGGTTGDTAGAVVELTEWACLLGLLA